MSVEEISSPLPHTESRPDDVWGRALAIIKAELSEQSFKTWVQQARFQKLEGGVLVLEVPDRFYGDWLKEHYQDIIRGAVHAVAQVKPEIQYVVSDRSFKLAHPSREAQKSAPQRGNLNTRYTFESFVIGPGNRFAHAAALAVSEAPAKNYNPLFIYGRVGLGKTHLMQAVAHHLLDKDASAKVVYISGEKFTTQLIAAIQTRSTPAFRAKFRTSDILLVDDIHFIAGKESTQEEFFNTFNTLYDAHKQIIVCSDRPPREIPGLEDRLISRFGGGW